jgi:hypothetical protein
MWSSWLQIRIKRSELLRFSNFIATFFAVFEVYRKGPRFSRGLREPITAAFIFNISVEGMISLWKGFLAGGISHNTIFCDDADIIASIFEGAPNNICR